MTIETFGSIHQLDTSHPTNVDLLSEGDDHIRGIKSTLKDTFPSINGSVNITHTKLNALDESITAGTNHSLTFKGDLTVKSGSTYKSVTAKQVTVDELTPSVDGSLITKKWATDTFSNKNQTSGALGSITSLYANKVPRVTATTSGATIDGKLTTYTFNADSDSTIGGSLDVTTKVTVGNTLIVKKGDLEVTKGSAHIEGSLSVGNSISFKSTCTRSSDERLKANIEPLDIGTDDIEPVKYLKGGMFEYGVIAQQVQPTIPHAVIEDAQGYLGVDYNNLIPMLILDIKRLKTRLEALEGGK